MDFEGFPYPQDQQVTYSFHYYPQVWNPNIMDKELDKHERKDMLSKSLSKMTVIRDKYNRPLWCGEFGCVFGEVDPAFEIEFIKDTIDLFEQEEISWALWSYKDSKSMGIVYPADNTPWFSFISEIRSMWNLPDEMKAAEKVLVQTAQNLLLPINNDQKYILQFRLRAIFQEIYSEQILKPQLKKIQVEETTKLADSFLFHNCNKRDDLSELIKSYTNSI